MRILFFGNTDNLGYELCKWCREFGAEAEAWSFEHEQPRCQPELVDPAVAGRYPNWFRIVDGPKKYLPMLSRRRAGELEGRFDVLVASGARGLMASRAVRLPKALYAIGGDVSEAPFAFAARWRGVPIALYRILRWPLARAAIRDMDAIIENYAVNLDALKRLGLSHKRVNLGMPEDALGARAKIDPAVLARLQARYGRHRRVFIWLTRLSFLDPEDAAYKGAERFLEALDEVRGELASGEVRLVIGTHGHDVAPFQSRARASGYEPFIDWVPHLPFTEMLAHLALPNGVAFGKFGERLGMPAAIDRDAWSVGAVLVSTVDLDYAAEIYGARPPVLSATTVPEIRRRMRETLEMDELAFAALRERMRAYGAAHADYRVIVPRFLELLRGLPARRRSGG